MSFLRITAVESLRTRGLQNSSARTCESNKGVLSNLAEPETLDNLETLKFPDYRGFPGYYFPLRSYQKRAFFYISYVFFAVQSESDIRFLRSNL